MIARVLFTTVLALLASPCRAEGPRPGRIRHGISLEMLRVDHPATFVKDERPDPVLEMSHGTRFKDPGSDLVVEVIPYGWVPENKNGFKSVEDYLKRSFVSGHAVRTQFTGYARLVDVSASEVRVFFFTGESRNQVQSLRFSFGEGGYAGHRVVIEEIIASARPKFSRSRRAEWRDDLKLLGTPAAD